MSSLKGDLGGLMWSEKYRPARLQDVVDQKEIITALTSLIRGSDVPHMLFAGPAGTGKTTTALCVARELLGNDWRRDTLDLNASDERGIKMVRERVKEFASVMKLTTDSSKQHDRPFRIIILDEADEMTPDAQTALRRIIEDSSKTTRFIFICNYLSQIIEPIQSRCAVFRFTRLPEEEVVDYLRMICEKEKVRYEEKALSQIYSATMGDMRHSINILQTAAGMGSVSAATVASSIGLSGRARVGEVIKMALAGRFNESRAKLMELVQVYGMSETDFLRYANQEAYEMKLDRPDEFAELMAEYDYRLASGAHPEIQLAALLAQLGRIGLKSREAKAEKA